MKETAISYCLTYRMNTTTLFNCFNLADDNRTTDE